MPETECTREDFDAVIEAEQRLLDPAVRADRAAVEALLHPEFTEIGASGRLWRRDEIIDAVVRSARGKTPETRDFAASVITHDTVLLTYDCHGTSRTRRSSIWQRVDGAWRVRFHQGTPVPPTAGTDNLE